MDLISAPQNFTSGWVYLGEAVDMTDATRAAIYLDVDSNDTLTPRIRAVGKINSKDVTQLYPFPIKNVGASSAALEAELFEFNVDADQKMILEVETKGLVNFLQFQIQAGTVGATAGQIESAYLIKSSY